MNVPEPCLNSSSWDDGPAAVRCVLPVTERARYPDHDDMHRDATGTHGWGDPPPAMRRWCWRCLWKRRFLRRPITNKYGWSWQYEDKRGHWRNNAR